MKKVITNRQVTDVSKKYMVKRNSSGYSKAAYPAWMNGYTTETKKAPKDINSKKTSNVFKKDKTYNFSKKAKLTLQDYDPKTKKYSGKNTYTFYYCSKEDRWCIYKDLEGRKRLGEVESGSLSSIEEPKKKTTTKTSKEEKELKSDVEIEKTKLGSNPKKFIKDIAKKSFGQDIAKQEKDTVNHSEYGVKITGNMTESNKDSITDKNFTMSDFDHLIRSKTIHYADRNLWTTKYNRMQYANPYFVNGPTREYLFFTKPNLHIMRNEDTSKSKLNTELANDPFWIDMKHRYRRIISYLQYSARRTSGSANVVAMDRHEFIPILTNAVSSSLDMPGSSADTVDTAANIYGTSIQYRKGSFKSDEGYDFSLEFIDNPYLDVYYLFKMWDEYENLKSIGAVTPPGKRHKNPYRLNKLLHDQIGIFKFIVADDMETILYYAYFTGCFPKSVPRDAFNNLNPGLITYSIDWHAQFVEDSNPMILAHFNRIQKKYLGISDKMTQLNSMGNNLSYTPLYNDRLEQINGGWRDVPYVVKVAVNEKVNYKYLLRWYDLKK